MAVYCGPSIVLQCSDVYVHTDDQTLPRAWSTTCFSRLSRQQVFDIAHATCFVELESERDSAGVVPRVEPQTVESESGGGLPLLLQGDLQRSALTRRQHAGRQREYSEYRSR